MKQTVRAAAISFPIFLAIFFCFSDLVPLLRRRYDDQMEIWMDREIGRPTVLPTLTPYPYLGEKEAQARIATLFETNGGCRLPCWWGIVPGKTSWQEVHASLSPFMDSETGQYLSDDDELFTYGYYYDLPSHTGIEIGVHDDLPVANVLISDVPSEYLSNLRLSRIFQTYGRPDGIYIRSPYFEIGHQTCVGVFDMFVYYPAEGFAIQYRYQPYAVKQTIRVCGLDQPSVAGFYVWDPAASRDFQVIAEDASWYPGQYKVRPIEEVTGWTTESFFAAYQPPAEQTFCIEAPPFDWSSIPGNRNQFWWCE